MVFDSPNYGKVGCLIKIADGVAIANFSDYRLAKDMFREEKKLGNKNININERLKCLIELYPGKFKEDIAKELVLKFKEHNIKVTQK